MPGESHDPIDLHELTDDEAIAFALDLCPEGESIHIHAAGCPVEPDALELCNCSPLSLKKGAKG